MYIYIYIYIYIYKYSKYSTCNLKTNLSNEIPVAFHNGSTYDC